MASPGRHPRVQLPCLKSLFLYDSINFLPFVFPIHSSSLEKLFIITGHEDENFKSLLVLLNLQSETTIDLAKHDGSLQHFASRIAQLIEGLEWPVDRDRWEDGP